MCDDFSHFVVVQKILIVGIRNYIIYYRVIIYSIFLEHVKPTVLVIDNSINKY